jgi:serine/threonine protein kinase/WD40 repeat protein
MRANESTVDDDNAILARIALEIESASDPNEVIRRYCEEFPQLAERIRGLCHTWLALQEIGVESSDLAGTKLGSFTLEKRIGQGMSVVYAATEDPPLKRRVALKIMRLERNSSPKAAKQFELEQELLARLNNPHIVPILQTGFESGLQYFVMPLIDGASLGSVARAAYEITTSRPGLTCPSVAELARGASPDADSNAARPHLQCGQNGLAAPSALDSAQNISSQAGPSVLGEQARFANATSLPASRGVERLSKVYFRSVAQVISDVATAVHHVHSIGVLHRDIKPSNIMVTTQGEARLIDLGLAQHFVEPQIDLRQADEGESATAHGPAHTGKVGTPQYMAPEQIDGRADTRTDVWGLGTTLYELLTLRRAFPGSNGQLTGLAERRKLEDQIKSDEPPRPRSLISNIPRDLEAICLKAIRKSSSERYQSAQEIADDLRRWLNGEPCHAWPPGWNRRLRGPRGPLALKALVRRRPKSAAAAILALISVFATITIFQLRAAAAEAQAAAANHQSQLHQEQAAAKERQLQLRELQRLRLKTHDAGWSEEAWTAARKQSIDGDTSVRDEAASTLMGWDARLKKQFRDPSASLAFDAAGKRLLMAGSTATLWDSETDEVINSRQIGPGPLAFDASGSPLQLATDPASPSQIILWDIGQQEVRRRFPLIHDAAEQELDEDDSRLLAVSSDGSFVAASAKLTNGRGVAAIWEAATGREVHRDDALVTAVAFSADARFIALAADGHVTVRTTDTAEEVLRFSTGRAKTYGISFGRDPRPVPSGAPAIDRLRLAVGGVGGLITVWNLRDSTVVAQYRGSHHDVYSLDFNMDGTLLVSAGRLEARLWDVATGRLLLTFARNNTLPAVRFSADATNVAVGAVPGFGPGGVQVWQLENGRGIKSLHGLASTIAKVCYSPDERLIAGLSHDWQVGIWEVQTGKLQHLLELHQGLFADNAALAFSPDGGRFAFSTGDRATMWDVATGQLVNEWPLPPGLQDHLAFHSSGKLLSVRIEIKDKKLPPYGHVPWRDHPRVIRLRDLLSQQPELSIKEIGTFNWGGTQSLIARDGSYFVFDGLGGSDELERSIRAYEGLTGEEMWAITGLPVRSYTPLHSDPKGELLGLMPSESEVTLVKMPRREFHRLLPEGVQLLALGPGAHYRVGLGESPRFGYYLRRGDSSAPLVVLGMDIETYPVVAQFNVRGTHLASGNADGTVWICDVREVQTRLTELGFGW